MESTFPIPSSIQDLERSPYNLLPYPSGFADDDEATRAESFSELVSRIEQSNRTLKNSDISLFETPDGEDGFDEWNDEERIQALYTLVRKSASLAPSTRKRLIIELCEAVQALSNILTQVSSRNQSNASTNNGHYAVPQSFRDAFACHLYMLYTIMVFTESEIKAEKALGNTTGGKKSGAISQQDKERKNELGQTQKLREQCAITMGAATNAMVENKSILWKRGVPDENVVGLPCRIAYLMLENATGVVARKLASGDLALQIIAATIDSVDTLINTIVAALVDLLHSFEHIAKLVSELCCLVSPESENKIAIELLREIGRLDIDVGTNAAEAGGKASGIRNIAPFINELAEKKPRIVLKNISLVLPQLHCDAYTLRSAIVTAIGHILVCCKEDEEENEAEELEEESTASPKQKRKSNSISEQRSELFDILIDRSRDVSSYTRVAVLKAWANLIQSQAIPLNRLIPVTELAIDRLQDKTVMVRRSAMQILTLVLENNPFNDSLDPKPYKAKMEEVRNFILENLPSDMKEAKENALSELEDDDEHEIKNVENAAIKAAIAEFEMMSENDEKRNILMSKAQAMRFLSSAITFINLFESSNPTFQGMLLSSNNSDVTEALRFFVRARNFQLPSAFSGIKTSLSLMWSDDKGIQEEVKNAFVEVFIAVPGTEMKTMLPSNHIVDNLIRLVHKATVSELTCIEEVISRLVKDELIPADVFLILWSIAAKAPGKPRSAAMMLLSMAASADPGIVDSPSRLRHLLEAGFGDYIEQRRDWDTARSAACALQRVSRVKPDPTSSKFIILEQIVERLCSIIQGVWCDDHNAEDTKAWFGAAEQAINAIFVVCPAPEQVSRVVILAMEGPIFGHSQGKSLTSCHSLRLARFLFVLGHIVIKVLVYVESLTGALRNANAARTLSKQEEADKARSSENNEDAIEAELGVSQAAEAETEQKMAEIVEKEIIGRGLIGLFAPLLVRIVANENGQYSSETLMQSATLALCKFMCISSTFCEKHLPLLFTKLANAPTKDATLRANTVIALGDLAFRFPNEFEPYTPRLYACLRDESTKVRRHTLMVLTHLILNDMVKVKGQVCEIALCLRDEEVRIRDMARLLFHELSKRSNNPIYNLLPDIVSQLSNMTVNKDDFRNIMSFLLGFIQKERQNEMLVDKLCLRFPKCTSISQKANISFCLAQLKINDRSMKLLNDHFKLYQDALFDDDVMKNFMSLVTKTKKFAKPELKQQIDEWESKLVEHSAMGVENKLAGDKAKQAKQKKNKRQSQRKQRPTRGEVTSKTVDDFDKENIEISNS